MLILYGRHGCHLCDVMHAELELLLAGTGCQLKLEDVDSRDDWRRLYGERVPVLVDESGDELCHFHLDERAVLGWLKSGI